MANQIRSSLNPAKSVKRCKQCGKKFELYKTQTKKFCSSKCRKQANQYKIAEKLSNNICLVCGIEISRKNAIYCSDRCRKNNLRHPPNFKEIKQYNFYNQIKDNIGLDIPILNTDDFVNWVKQNFFLFGLKSIKVNGNIVVFQTSSDFGRLELRYFGCDDFEGLAFVASEKSTSKAFFKISGCGRFIRMTDFFLEIVSAQKIFKN